MYFLVIFISVLLICKQITAEKSKATLVYENDMNFRIDPGARTCFFEKGRAGQWMEAHYQVVDGQHGDLDITFEIISPTGVKLLTDYKKSQNTVIMDLEVDGDYVFCMDNSFSVMNSKLVFVYVMIENRVSDDGEATVSVLEDGEEEADEVIEWMGYDDDGEPYYIEVPELVESLVRILKHVMRARQMLDMYRAMKSRDNYLAFEDTFIVDVWSAFQISFMCFVGLMQVYMIKKLFNRPSSVLNNYYY